MRCANKKMPMLGEEHSDEHADVGAGDGHNLLGL
jgi:hypothetical protein